MSKSQHSPMDDRNLLFGILALQMNFVSRDGLVGAMQAWMLDRNRPLGKVLLEQERLTTEQFQAIDALLVQHLKVHGDDPGSSLSALSSMSPVGSLVALLSDATATYPQPNLDPMSEAKATRSAYLSRTDGSRYRILRPHAHGGLGVVFVAEDTELHREVALKEIQPAYADVPESRCRFVREAQITGGLEHPGIVAVYGLGAYPDGRHYYAMRFIRGESLKEGIERFHAVEATRRNSGECRLAFRGLLRRFIDMCNAVAYAHSRGVIHRDLKPSNVMLGKFGETLVVDWGLAKAGVEPISDKDAADAPTTDPALHPLSDNELSDTRVGGETRNPGVHELGASGGAS